MKKRANSRNSTLIKIIPVRGREDLSEKEKLEERAKVEKNGEDSDDLF